MLKLESNVGEPTRLKQLSWVEGMRVFRKKHDFDLRQSFILGQAIGSALIDFRFHKLVTDRLNTIRNHLQKDPDEIADRMLKKRFEKYKCSFGTGASDVPEFTINVDGLPQGSNFPEIGIMDNAMSFKRFVCHFR